MVQNPAILNKSGLLLCAKYALPPNYLHYCGGQQPTAIAQYQQAQFIDPGLQQLLGEFITMNRYLQLIAKANYLTDPFDWRVVQAYWLGNNLLKKISPKLMYGFLQEEFKLNKQLKGESLTSLLDVWLQYPWPQHNWHVLTVFAMTGKKTLPFTLATINQCKISAGQIVSLTGQQVTVRQRPLILKNNQLIWGPAEEILIGVEDFQFPNLQVGQFISFHWGRFCDIISPIQAKALEQTTSHNLACASLAFNQ